MAGKPARGATGQTGKDPVATHHLKSTGSTGSSLATAKSSSRGFNDASISIRDLRGACLVTGRSLSLRTSYLDIQIGDAQRVVTDEIAARLDGIAHELGENVVGLIELADVDLEQSAGIGVEGGFP